MLKLFSELLNGAVVSSVVAVALLATPAPAPHAVHNAFACVRPSYSETMVVDGGSPRTAKVFNGFRLCRETLPTDKDGFVVFPEA